MHADELLAELKCHANPERAASMAAYMKHRFDYLGIAKPQLAKIGKPFFKNAAAQPVDWPFIQHCWASPWREMQYAALEYLKKVQAQLTPQDVPRLQRLITTQSWWDTADFLDRIVGGIALRHPEVNAVLLDWSQSDNIWLRRVAIDHQLLRKAQTANRYRLAGTNFVQQPGAKRIFHQQSHRLGAARLQQNQSAMGACVYRQAPQPHGKTQYS